MSENYNKNALSINIIYQPLKFVKKKEESYLKWFYCTAMMSKVDSSGMRLLFFKKNI